MKAGFFRDSVALAVTAAVLSTLSGCGDGGAGANSDSTGNAEGSVDFVTEVKPILQAQCVRCHHDGAIMGGLNLMNREAAMRGSSRGPVIVPGEPEKSPLYRVTLLPEEENHAMPATGPKLTADEQQILHNWIEEGANWPEGEEGKMAPIDLESDKV